MDQYNFFVWADSKKTWHVTVNMETPYEKIDIATGSTPISAMINAEIWTRTRPRKA